MPTRPRRLGALFVLPAVAAAVLALSGCASSSSPSTSSRSSSSSHPSGSSGPTAAPTAASSPSAPASPLPTGPVAGANTTVGVKVAHGFGASPTLTIPGTPAPSKLTAQVLTAGTGAKVHKGDLLVANYAGETWAPKSGKANVFDSSFSRGAPTAFPIGVGQVIPGWDKTLVGKRLGSRVLLTIPPADGYGSGGQPRANISGTDTLVFVIDLIAVYGPGSTAPGTAVASLPAGWPKVTNVAGTAPTIRSTAGVTAPSAPKSLLLVKGDGAPIDASKTLVMQVVETDLATGKDTQSSWKQAPQAVSAQNVLGIATVLKGQKIGSRAMVLLPSTPAEPASATAPSRPPSPAEVLIIDAVGQF